MLSGIERRSHGHVAPRFEAARSGDGDGARPWGRGARGTGPGQGVTAPSCRRHCKRRAAERATGAPSMSATRRGQVLTCAGGPGSTESRATDQPREKDRVRARADRATTSPHRPRRCRTTDHDGYLEFTFCNLLVAAILKINFH